MIKKILLIVLSSQCFKREKQGEQEKTLTSWDFFLFICRVVNMGCGNTPNMQCYNDGAINI